MSTAHLSLDDFAFPPHRPHSAYELSYALGQPQSSSLYPHSQHLEISPLAAQAPRQHHPLSTSDASHPLYLPEHPEAYLNPYGSGIAYPYLDSHLPSYALNHRPASPQAIYTANSAWGAPETYGGAPFEAAGPSSSSFLHSLQNVIESSHTSQVQQSINAAQAAAASQRPTTPSSSWTLSGSLDPATGVFQRSVEHPRLRTAQACEKCRIRKAKCSGDHPACQRCISRGLQCEYAPERKMRGPNKNKRKSIASQKSDKSTEDERRSSITSITSTISSNSDASAMDCPSADAMASAAAVAKSTTRPSSSASVHPASHQSPVQTEASRGRSTTVSVGALQHAAEYGASATSIGEQHASGPPGVRQRPPPLNLLDSRQFYSDMLSQYTRGGSELSAAYGDGTMDPHRTPLPNYLAEAYSRIAQSTHGEGSDGMYHEPSAFSAASAESSDMARYVPLRSLHL
ncbi:hypothetical protein PYCCODRAFT_1259471 [Trametes coccinea BRFM310]|uniref:Zn(2)-C6 fungal-type domain-containing protein n=1 Tax=Trametes coccinea (strain BRFM310) TaxID=1353009 RepID=A0A1Y2I7R5_TRAC3|nr:hypothetical protein PYCCODRAFT_1259471 [Trametes coccinea BRFM310]